MISNVIDIFFYNLIDIAKKRVTHTIFERERERERVCVVRNKELFVLGPTCLQQKRI